MLPEPAPQCGFLSALGFALGLIAYLGLLAFAADRFLQIIGALFL